MSFYSRKSPRIPNFDYSSANYYFITICTQNRRCIFGTVSELSRIGKIAEEHINQIESHYENVKIEKYVIMPNHIHMVLSLKCSGENNVEQIIAQYKSGVTREARKWISDIVIWQRSFHDHIIRNQNSYEKIWLYIEGNPQCWEKDCFFVE